MALQVAYDLAGHGCSKQSDSASMSEGMRTAFAVRPNPAASNRPQTSL